MKQSSHSAGKIVKALVVTLSGVATLGLLLWVVMFVVLRPKNVYREEIYSGVFLTVEDIPPSYGEGKVMIAEIHLSKPGVELFFSPFFPRATGRRHFTLMPADYLRWKHDLDIMINSTRYYPAEWWRSYPLQKVDSLETLVWEGNVSHIHRLSYMLGWDKDLNFSYEFSKPPSEEFLRSIHWGIGVQSISIHEGQILEQAMDQRRLREARTFLAVDPIRNVIWFLVAEHISEFGMNSIAQQQGAFIGGQLDCQDASNMIVGNGARGVGSYRGIRGRRPLAAVIGVRADPLPND